MWFVFIHGAAHVNVLDTTGAATACVRMCFHSHSEKKTHAADNNRRDVIVITDGVTRYSADSSREGIFGHAA